jgi:hypothetical protein
MIFLQQNYFFDRLFEIWQGDALPFLAGPPLSPFFKVATLCVGTVTAAESRLPRHFWTAALSESSPAVITSIARYEPHRFFADLNEVLRRARSPSYTPTWLRRDQRSVTRMYIRGGEGGQPLRERWSKGPCTVLGYRAKLAETAAERYEGFEPR